MKFVKIGTYWVNPDNIAYLSGFKTNSGMATTMINFNAYAAAANEMQSAFEPMYLQIDGISPDEVAASINPVEPAF